MNLEAFNIKDLQHFLMISQVFESEGITDPNIIRSRITDFLANKFKGKKVTAQRYKKIRCRYCGSYKTKLLGVNVSQSTIVDGPWKSVIVCGSCLGDDFREESVSDIMSMNWEK